MEITWEEGSGKDAAVPNHEPIVKGRKYTFSYIGEMSQSLVSNSAYNSPPNLASPRFGIGNTQESGSAP